jgi:hypothetical protein
VKSAVAALFDKFIEGRETQAAESWRVSDHANGSGSKETLAMLRFFSHHQDA